VDSLDFIDGEIMITKNLDLTLRDKFLIILGILSLFFISVFSGCGSMVPKVFSYKGPSELTYVKFYKPSKFSTYWNMGCSSGWCTHAYGITPWVHNPTRQAYKISGSCSWVVNDEYYSWTSKIKPTIIPPKSSVRLAEIEGAIEVPRYGGQVNVECSPTFVEVK